MTHLKPGDRAPKISAKDQNGEPISLENYKGQKVVLYFYPRDSTPTCTKEACNLRDNYSNLQKAGYVVLGVSNDGERSHKKFIEKFDLPFSLISDTDKQVVNDFGVYGEKKFMGKTIIGIHRTTFLIDEDRIITKIIAKVKSSEHSNQILAEEEVT